MLTQDERKIKVKNNRRIVKHQTLDTVRERERERELYSKEIGFINYAENIYEINNIKVDIKDGLYIRENLIYSLSFLCAKNIWG